MRQLQLAPLYIAMLMVIVSSCEWEQREELNLNDLPETISLDEHLAPIFAEKCTKCHNGSTPPNLEPENVYLDLSSGGYIDIDNPSESKIYEAINGGSMSQYANDLDRAYILKWIEQGGLEN